MNKRHPEAVEQTAFFAWVNFKLQQGDERFHQVYAIANVGSRHPAEGANLKRQGVKAGVADIAVDYPSGGYHGLKIEMKAGKNKPTVQQKEFLARAEKYGHKIAVCYSADEVIKTVEEYFKC